MISTSAYDGLGRRITKVVSNSGDLDMTYHFYYSGGEGQSIAEIRDGSELVLKQHVWATLANGYIDELLQTTANRDLFNNPSMDIPYPWGGGPWSDPLAAALYDSLHDANYNIQGLIEDATEGGNLVERYEYTPYGQRLVLRSSGGNDPLCHTPTFVSQRQASYIWTLGTPEELVAFPQPFGLNEFGHQGLYHDEEAGGGAGATLVYNRARMLHTRLGQFTQRDPLDNHLPAGGYHDGMSLYEYVRSNAIIYRDAMGLEEFTCQYSGNNIIAGPYVAVSSVVPGTVVGGNGQQGVATVRVYFARPARKVYQCCDGHDREFTLIAARSGYEVTYAENWQITGEVATPSVGIKKGILLPGLGKSIGSGSITIPIAKIWMNGAPPYSPFPTGPTSSSGTVLWDVSVTTWWIPDYYKTRTSLSCSCQTSHHPVVIYQ